VPYGALVQVRPSRRNLVGGAVVVLLVSCAEQKPPVDDEAERRTSVEVAELEINASGVDRFANCPPPGELGQTWVPTIPPWSPPASALEAASETADDSAPGALATSDPTLPELPAERASALTREAFRRCYNRGLVYDPTQDGHVAIILRVGRDGRVARVESYGACEIASETIACMQDVAKHIRLRPAREPETVVVHALFTQQGAARRGTPLSTDAYATAAYLAVEGARPLLHGCDEHNGFSGKPRVATASIALELDARGKVIRSHVDPSSGDAALVTCATQALERTVFPPPPGGTGSVLTRISFNPRSGAR